MRSDARTIGEGYRAAILFAIVVGHLLLAAALLWSVRHRAAPPTSRGLAMFDVPVIVPKPDRPAKPAVEQQVSDDPVTVELPAEQTAYRPVAAGSGDGVGCSVPATIGTALSADSDAMAELAALPPGLRTDADAVMVWNGTWIDAQRELVGTDISPIQAMKAVIAETLASLPPECRDVQTTGPQLIPIAETGRTTMLVVGSGVWRWSSLLDPATGAELAQTGGQSPGWFGAIIPSGN